MAALDRGLGELAAGCGLGLAGASGRGRPSLWAAPRGEAGLDPPRSLRGGPRAWLCCRRKHPLDEEPEDCPARKKRLTAAGLSPPAPAAAAAAERWVTCAGQPASPSVSSPPGLLDVPCEEMEQVTGEQQQQQQQQQQYEAARRKLQEIEARITDEDEEGLAEEPVGNLPTLVLSDTLKTGLKRDYTGGLTKKIIESMSRPSMELVVWKPLPEFLTKKAKSISVKNAKPMAERCPAKPPILEAAFNLQTGQFSEPQQTEMPSVFYSTMEPAGCSEEEMEL